jgi:glycosyltransferase involved in cell wall biosynthesis
VDLSLHWAGDWPEHLAPLLDALAALPEAATAPGGAVALCPDVLAMRPPDGPAVGLVPDITPLTDPARHPAAVAAILPWAARGLRLLTPTEHGTRALRSLPGVADELVGRLPLPLPPGRRPRPWADGGSVVVLHPQAHRPVLAASVVLGAAGLRPRIVLVGGDAERLARPGGPANTVGLIGGRDVLALADPAAIAAHAGVIVLGEDGAGVGWMLRQALATGRPVVAPSSWLIRDHLSALGTSAYLYAGDAAALALALGAALRGDRGPGLGAAGRAAVLAESWADTARGVLGALSDAVAVAGSPRPGPGTVSIPAPLDPARLDPARLDPARARGDGTGLAVDIVNLRASGGGGERFLRSLALAMVAHRSRPRVRVVCRVDPGVAFDPGVAQLRAAGIEFVPVTGGDVGATLAGLDAADVVYCSWPQNADPPDTELPLVCTYHDLNFKHFDVAGPEERERQQAEIPRWIERCAAIVHSSRFIESELHRFFDVPEGLTHVIPLTAEPPSGEAGPAARAAVRAAHGLGDERFLLSPNGNHLHKNYAALVQALRGLRDRGRPVRVIATGFATECFHGPDLIGLGYVSARELAALYGACAGIVQTTLYEAGSFPMMEAMAIGRPAAISAIAPVLEQIERLSLVAETFDPLDPEAIGDALWRLWTGGPATDPAALAANAAAVTARTWDDVAGDYLTLLDAVASRTPAPLTA